jgi:predicted lipid-binding transport protein (Tim44 family)
VTDPDATQPEQNRSGCAGWLASLLALGLIRTAVKELGWPEWWTLVGWALLVLIVAVVMAARRQAAEQHQQPPQEPPGRPGPFSIGADAPPQAEPEPKSQVTEPTTAAPGTGAPRQAEPEPQPQARSHPGGQERMRWLADPGDRTGADRVIYRIGSWIAILLMLAAVAAPIAWWLVWRR